MATITRRGKTYQVRIFLGRDPATGEQLFDYKTIRGTKKDAEMWARERERDRDLGEYLPPKPIPFSEAVENWLRHRKSEVSARTHEDYADELHRYVVPVLGSKLITAITPDDIKDLLQEMHAQGYSPRTRRHVLKHIKAILKAAVHSKQVKANPAERIKAPRKERQIKIQVFTPEEARTFLKAAKESRHWIVFWFALETGMRPEEYLGLQWPDIDFASNTVHVQRTITWLRSGGWEFGPTKTPQSARKIPLSAALIGELLVHKTRLDTLKKSCTEWPDYDLMFPVGLVDEHGGRPCEKAGHPIHRDNLNARSFKTILKSAGLESSMRLYDLRHTCCTLLLNSGVNPKVVSERMGHTDVAFTLQTYAHALPGQHSEVTAKLAELLSLE